MPIIAYNIKHLSPDDESWLAGACLDVEEKIDGYQCSFGWGNDGAFFFRSKTRDLTEQRAAIWDTAFSYAAGLQPRRGMTYFAEMVAREKMFKRTYARVPRHHMVLWDAIHTAERQRVLPRSELQSEGLALDLEVVPYARVWIASPGALSLRMLLGDDPLLGGDAREGVVLKDRNFDTPGGTAPYRARKLVA